jgi:hypothetical protein
MAAHPKHSDRVWIGGVLLIPLALVFASGSLRCQFSADSPIVWRFHEFRSNYDQAERAGLSGGKWTRAMIAFDATVLERPKKRCTS